MAASLVIPPAPLTHPPVLIQFVTLWKAFLVIVCRIALSKVSTKFFYIVCPNPYACCLCSTMRGSTFITIKIRGRCARSAQTWPSKQIMSSLISSPQHTYKIEYDNYNIFNFLSKFRYYGIWYEHTNYIMNIYKTGVIDDPLGQTHSPACSNNFFHFKIALFFEILTYMCENCDHYRPWLWIGLVDQNI